MRRALVLNDESAQHPFRAILPPHVRLTREEFPGQQRSWWRLTASDVRGFATAYFATFAAALAFIA